MPNLSPKFKSILAIQHRKPYRKPILKELIELKLNQSIREQLERRQETA